MSDIRQNSAEFLNAQKIVYSLFDTKTLLSYYERLSVHGDDPNSIENEHLSFFREIPDQALQDIILFYNFIENNPNVDISIIDISSHLKNLDSDVVNYLNIGFKDDIFTNRPDITIPISLLLEYTKQNLFLKETAKIVDFMSPVIYSGRSKTVEDKSRIHTFLDNFILLNFSFINGKFPDKNIHYHLFEYYPEKEEEEMYTYIINIIKQYQSIDTVR